MYSHTRKWVNPQVQEQNQRISERIRLNTARRKFCPRSPFFHANFDIIAHKIEWEAVIKRAQANRITCRLMEASRRKQLSLPPAPPIKSAFTGHKLVDNFAPVTCWRTVFTPAYDNPDRPLNPEDPFDKEPGQWPCRAEMKYEGDERISTDKLHGRCLAAPRVEGNETVNWMHRSIVPQYPLDDLYYPPPSEVDIWIRTHHIPELEVSDEEGRTLLGAQMMEALDLDQVHPEQDRGVGLTP